MPDALPRYPAGLLINPRHAVATTPEREPLAAARAAFEEITSWPDYAPTPLIAMPGLARRLGIGDVRYKDEGGRFGLGSFKALGGAYAVFRMAQRAVAERTGSLPSAAALRRRRHRGVTETITVTTATDGNHGRAVAWGARCFGCRAVIYVPAACSAGRAEAIADLGAEVVRIDGSYDEAVARCAADAAASGWRLIADTSTAGDDAAPREVMQGYTVMAEETLAQWPSGAGPSHLFIQAGVGALPAAVARHYRARLGPSAPRIVVVEPDGAACMWASAHAGRPATAPEPVHSVMAGLDCGQASPLAWAELDRAAFAFMTVPDRTAAELMRLLAEAPFGDAPVVAGESAVAGLAGLIAASGDPAARAALGLDRDSRVLLFGTEGATDAAIYAKLTGRPPEAVDGGQGKPPANEPRRR